MSKLLSTISDFFQSGKRNQYPERLRNNGKSVFDYPVIMALDEKEYPQYLKDAYYIKFGQKLNLRHPKNINEKIQWLKIYDNLPIKTQLTDKLLVRDWVKDKIGEKYLKPVLWIGAKFEDIPFENLPDDFVIKCNHGCKWQFIIKNKDKFIKTKSIYEYTKNKLVNWLNESFFGWSDFETQYKNIRPKIIIEPFLVEENEHTPLEIEVWCFNGKPKIIQRIKETVENNKICKIVNSFDENFNFMDIKFYFADEIVPTEPDEKIKLARDLSEILSKNFKLVRVDWMIYDNKLYFNEMTFTPYSGFIVFPPNNYQYYNILGKMLNLK